MATFEQHVNVAVIATGVLIVPLHSSGILDVSQSIAVLGLGLIGGLLPDLDSDNSKPIQIVFKILSIFLPLLILLAIPVELSILKMIIAWVVASLVLHLTVFKLFLSLTVHRGIFHTIPMGILFGQLTTAMFYYVIGSDLTFSTIAGIFITFGFFIHLLLDEFISLNALGLRMKKSFGTAFKLYYKHNILGTAILYLLVVASYFVLQIDNDIFNNIYTILKNSKVI